MMGLQISAVFEKLAWNGESKALMALIYFDPIISIMFIFPKRIILNPERTMYGGVIAKN